MVVDMRFLPVLLLLLFLRIVVAVGDVVVVMVVCVPERPVFPLVGYSMTVMVRHMVMIVAVRSCLMGMLRLFAFAFGTLWCCRWM